MHRNGRGIYSAEFSLVSIDTLNELHYNKRGVVTMIKGKFPLGQTVLSQGVACFIEDQNIDMIEVIALLAQHQDGNWGDVDDDDWTANDDALADGGRLLSAYELEGERVWVITEWDRSATTVLFPRDY